MADQDLFKLIFSFVFAFAAAIEFLMLFILWMTFDRRLKSIFNRDKNIWPIKNIFIRLICYAGWVVFHKMSKNNKYRNALYGDFDFRENAKPHEKILSYIFVYSASAIILMVISISITDFLGFTSFTD